MPYTNRSSLNTLLSCYSLRSSHWIIKTFIVLVICNGLRTIKRNTVNASDKLNVQKYAGVVNENSTKSSAQLQLMPMTSGAVTHANNRGNNVLGIKNFDGNYSRKNQMISDNIQQHKVITNDTDSLLLAVEDCTRITNCGCQTSAKNCCGQISDTATQAIHKLIKQTATIDTGTALTTFSLPSKSLTSLSSSSAFLLPLSLSPSSSSSSGTTGKSVLRQPQQQSLLSRPKRYLSFPEGSSFSVAVCFTVGIIGNPRYNYMSFGLNWGVAYDLPNTTWILNHLHGFAKRPIPLAAWHRRSRRSLYKEIENLVDNMGYNGRDCVLRALCESRQYFQKTKMGMIGEMLRVIFSLPKQRIYTREITENSDIKLYDRAYRKGRPIDDCSETYDCSFSLLELAFGRYSTPPTGYYKQH